MIKDSLEKHLLWLQAVLDKRINHHFDDQGTRFTPPPAPELDHSHPLDQTFAELKMEWQEKIILLLALAPHLRPQLLDVFFTHNAILNRGYTEFGGIKGKIHTGFLPTKETAVFVLAGNHLSERVAAIKLLQPERPLFRRQLLDSTHPEPGEPLLSAALNISKTFLPRVLWQETYQPEFGADFPAQRVSTQLEWSDLVLSPYVMDQIREIQSWLQHENLIQNQWKLGKWIKPGYRSLFYGPPGTGKTLTASLLGKEMGMEVYRIDLAMVISKYIGETEKNLAKVFDLAELNHWILFFDEADALFGKRSLTKSSNDRYANQEVSYLLQRIEDFPGVIILASNFKGNLDEAFIRRFQSLVHFPAPDSRQRLALWQKLFNDQLPLAEDVDLEQLADRYKITGGEMINILRSVTIRAAERSSPQILLEDIMEAMNKEYQKNGKALNL